jgi:adenosylmethionine-8-amino-7-oxononanoate aminotransferase
MSAVLHRNLHAAPRYVTSSEGSFITLDDGQVILDATGGAAVSCLGHGHPRIIEAMKRQAEQVAYCHSPVLGTEVADDLAQELCDGTDGVMKRALIVSSGLSSPLLLAAISKS